MGVPIMMRYRQTGSVARYSDTPEDFVRMVMDDLDTAVSVDIQNVCDTWIESGLSPQGLEMVRSPWHKALFEFSWGGALTGVLVIASPSWRGSNCVMHSCVVFNMIPDHLTPVMTGALMFATDEEGKLALEGTHGDMKFLPFSPPEIAANDEELKKFHSDIVACVGVAMGGIAFANCKNIKRVESESAYPSRQARRAAERRGDPKPPRFYTLRIDPNATRKQSEQGNGHSGRQLSLHIVRGHFATYTEDRKLFGKHTGTFWVPAHVRGSQDVGIVGKDYAVCAPVGAQ